MKRIWVMVLLPWTLHSMRVLSVLPSTARSHYLPGRKIILELLKRGHSVTSISPFEEKPMENFTWIPVEVESIFDAVPKLKEEIGQDYTFFGYMRYVWRTINAYTEYITKQPKLSNFMKTDDSKFDLVFAHDFFQPIFYVFAHKYKAPLVVISTFGHAHYINEYTANNFDALTVPHEFSQLNYPMTCLDVIRNVAYTLFDFIARKAAVHRYQNGLVENVYALSGVPNLEDLERDVALVLVNSHFSTSIERSLLPNVVEVGGIHIEETKPLDKELQEILDGSEHGAILFSLGSVLDLGSQKDLFVNNVLKVLGSLKQRVLIKCNSDAYVSGYSNLYMYPWLPQNDVLAHPNLRLFISHGGLLSNHEAVHHKVPLICIPFQATQPMVCQRSVQLGYATELHKDDLDVANFNRSIQTMLADKTFEENIEKVSQRFRDRPGNPVDTAVFWMEYCAVHKRIIPKRSMHSSWLMWTTSFFALLVLFRALRLTFGVSKVKDN